MPHIPAAGEFPENLPRMSLDDRVGQDEPTLSAADQAFAERIASAARRAKEKPQRFAGFLNGLLTDGTIDRPGVRSALAPFMKLPKPEARTLKRARMAFAMSNAMAARDCVTEADLRAAGFNDNDIADTDLRDEAARVAGLAEMVA